MTEILLFRGATPRRTATRADLIVDDGVIAEVGAGPQPRRRDRGRRRRPRSRCPASSTCTRTCASPATRQSETILTGSRAAAAGGYTAVFAMPNTSPVADTAGVVEQELALGEAAGLRHRAADRRRHRRARRASGSPSSARWPTRAPASASSATTASACGIRCIMRRALEYVKAFDGVIAQHAQDPRLTEGAQMNEGAVSAELGLAGWPAVAEESIIARDVLLAEHVGSRLHVCHLSTAGSVEIIRWAKRRGVDVTAEVTPHHLLLTDELARGYDARFKVNPPLRREEDVARACARASPTARSTSSPPTTPRTRPRRRRASGTPPRTAWSASRARCASCSARWSTPGCSTGRTSRACMSRDARPHRPARRARHAARRPGQPASLTLYDPAPVRAVLDRATCAARSVNSPYLGRELPGEVRWTLHRGVGRRSPTACCSTRRGCAHDAAKRALRRDHRWPPSCSSPSLVWALVAAHAAATAGLDRAGRRRCPRTRDALAHVRRALRRHDDARRSRSSASRSAASASAARADSPSPTRASRSTSTGQPPRLPPAGRHRRRRPGDRRDRPRRRARTASSRIAWRIRRRHRRRLLLPTRRMPRPALVADAIARHPHPDPDRNATHDAPCSSRPRRPRPRGRHPPRRPRLRRPRHAPSARSSSRPA